MSVHKKTTVMIVSMVMTIINLGSHEQNIIIQCVSGSLKDFRNCVSIQTEKH